MLIFSAVAIILACISGCFISSNNAYKLPPEKKPEYDSAVNDILSRIMAIGGLGGGNSSSSAPESPPDAPSLRLSTESISSTSPANATASLAVLPIINTTNSPASAPAPAISATKSESITTSKSKSNSKDTGKTSSKTSKPQASDATDDIKLNAKIEESVAKAAVAIGKPIPNPKEWCDYLKSTPEPQVILYNRLPKSASSTMEVLFESIANRPMPNTLSDKSQYVDVETWSAHSQFWTDMGNPKNAKIRDSFVREVNNKLRAKNHSKSIIVDGHFAKYNFPAKSFGQQRRYEYIQLTRNCISRRRSMFYYGLFDSLKARKINSGSIESKIDLESNLTNVISQSHHNKGAYTENLLDFQLQKLGIHALGGPENKSNVFRNCLNSKECLSNPVGIKNFLKVNTELYFFCGQKCANNETTYTKGSLENIYSPKEYTVIGDLDKLEEFLDMLECAYPKAMKGIRRLYDRKQIHKNEGTLHNSTAAVEEIIANKCEESSYNWIYYAIKAFAGDRYQYMKKNRSACCRPGYSYLSVQESKAVDAKVAPIKTATAIPRATKTASTFSPASSTLNKSKSK